MKTATQAGWWWLLLLLALASYVFLNQHISADLRLFMPTPETPEQKLLIEEIGEGPGARLLLLAIEGDAAESLAESSLALQEALSDDPLFSNVANGSSELASFPDEMLAYRYLLANTLDTQPFDVEFLRAQLQQRVADMSSPAASLLKPWVRRDPTLEMLKLAERWRPAQEPELAFDVWMSPEQDRALLIAETRAAGFDPRAQAAAIERIQQRFDALRSTPTQSLIISGPGAFATLMQKRTSGEATRLGALATVAMVFLLLIAYRRPRVVILAALPLVTAVLTGMATVTAIFGSMHGITLAFGCTLIGVAQDYPIHLLSHQHRGLEPLQNARRLWPTLFTGVLSTCVAYLSFLFSGVTGLAQLAAFSIAGLLAAALSTRYFLPHFLQHFDARAADSHRMARWVQRINRMPRPRWLPLMILVGSAAVLALPRGPLFENNLASLAPIPSELLQQDAQLRKALAAPDVRHMLVVRGGDVDALLARSEQLIPELEALVDSAVIQSFDLAARYLPSRATQLRRQAALPDASVLRADLASALQDSPFKPDIFEAFINEVQSARALKILTPADLGETPLGLRVDSLLMTKNAAPVALVALSGVADIGALSQWVAAQGGDVQWLDMKATSEQLVIGYRQHVLFSLAISVLFLLLVIAVSLRNLRRIAQVMLPMLLSSALVPALLHLAGIPMNLFHLIALVLAAGLGLDYALFFEHAESSPAAQRRTLHSLLVCAVSTLLVFALLATATIPVLRAIGLTVTLGVISNFVLAALYARRRTSAFA